MLTLTTSYTILFLAVTLYLNFNNKGVNSKPISFVIIIGTALIIYSLNYLYMSFYLANYLPAFSLYSSNPSGIINSAVVLSITDFWFYWPFLFVFVTITSLTLIYVFSYNESELNSFTLYVYTITTSAIVIFNTNSILLFFVAYELLLVPSFLILYSYAKTRKAVEAAFLMFFWTQFGAVFLIFNFQYLFFVLNISKFSELNLINLSSFELNFLFVTLVFGFGVKFPVWPFYDWLPKAHVEASTNFSIFLSGVLVKFAFFGFLKYLVNLGLDTSPAWITPFILIGFLDSSFKVYYQIDLKKLVAYSTVIEMHWLLFSVISGNSFFWVAGFAMMISHALLSSNFFLVIDSITRRFKTRLTTELSSIAYIVPNLYWAILIILLIFLGFPGSLLFISEVLFFSTLLDLNFFLFFIVFFLSYFFVPSCFFKSWFLLMFGGNKQLFGRLIGNSSVDLDSTESLLLLFGIILIFWMGFSFQFFF